MNRNKYSEQVDSRDYNTEAKNLVRGLSKEQCYELFEICLKKLQRFQTPTREEELNAVIRAVRSRKDLDRDLIFSRERGYQSEMARGAKAKDGNTEKHKKRV